MKKLLSFALSMVLLLTGALAYAETIVEYDTQEPVTFSVTTSQTMNVADYNSGHLYDYMAEKFNITLDVQPVPYANQDEKMRTLMTADMLPDTVCWLSFNPAEYKAFCDSGVIAPLPDGWETKYPNMYGMMQATGIYSQLIAEDGKVYAVPHATFYAYNKGAVSENGVVPHSGVYYRKDWVEKLGMEPFGDMITKEQYIEYLTKAVEQDLAGNGKTFGITTAPSTIISAFMAFTDCHWDTFEKTENGYEYGLLQPGVVETIEELRALYQNGIIYPDFFNITDSDQMFCNALSASKIDAGVCNTINWTRNNLVGYYESQNVEFDPDNVGLTAMCDAEGNWHGAYNTNYWTASVFNPNIDAVKMDRILSIIDWLCTQEGERICQMGVPEVDWTVSEDGEYISLMPAKEDGTPMSMWDNSMSYSVWRQLGILSDDFQLINPTFSKAVRDTCAHLYAVKNAKNVAIPLDLDYRFYSSDAKNIMSIPFNDEITRLMMAPEADVAAEWATFIENYRNMWEPVLNELNAEFYGK